MTDEPIGKPSGDSQTKPDEVSKQVLNTLEKQHLLPAQINPAAAVAAVMCVLFQRITGGQSREILDQLPDMLRDMLRVCAIHSDRPEVFDREVFLERVGEHLNVSPEMAETVTRKIFEAIRPHLSREEIDKVKNQLPADMSDLWDPPRPDQPEPRDSKTVSPEAASAGILKEVAGQNVLPAHINARDAVAAVMCVLSRRISGGEARKLLIDLPLPLQPMVRPCTVHEETPVKFGELAFTRLVAQHLDVDQGTADQITRAVFGAVKKQISAKEVDHVTGQLPMDLSKVWTEAAPGKLIH